MLLNTYNGPKLWLPKQEALTLASKLIELVGTADRTPTASGSGFLPIMLSTGEDILEHPKTGVVSIFVSDNENF